MCILFVYVNPNPKKDEFRLILASNRDEYYDRPAVKAGYHCFGTKLVMAGTDAHPGREGGMWLGISLQRSESDELAVKVAALLNVTGETRKDGAAGRGHIVSNFLKNAIPYDDYIKTLEMDKLNAFNFITIELNENEAPIVNHQSNAPLINHHYEGENTLGFGNSTVEAPLSKVKDGVEEFSTIVLNHGKVDTVHNLIDELIKLLQQETEHLPDPELQKRAPSAYKFLSSIFVRIAPARYGTRTHSVILIDHDGYFHFTEKSMKQPIDLENPEWVTQQMIGRI